MESQKKYPPTFSFEFFPPKTPEGMEKLRATWKQLLQLKPRFFSVTYGVFGGKNSKLKVGGYFFCDSMARRREARGERG